MKDEDYAKGVMDLLRGTLLPKNTDAINLNIALFNGSGKDLNRKLISEAAKMSAIDLTSTAFVDTIDIPHHDIISNPFKQFLGEQQRRRFKPGIVDASVYNQNLHKENFLAEMQMHIGKELIMPIKQRVGSMMMQRYQVADITQLDADQQKQLDMEVQAAMEQELPMSLIRKLQDKSWDPYTEELQKLLKIVVNDMRLKDAYDDCFEKMLKSGFTVIYHGTHHYEARTRRIDPRGFGWEDNARLQFIHKARSCRYEESMTLEELVATDEITQADIKGMERFFQNNYLNGGPIEQAFDDYLLYGVPDAEGDIRLVNTSHVQGRDEMFRRLAPFFAKFGSIGRIHYVWQYLMPAKRVLRRTKSGVYEKHWRDMNYVSNSARGDVEVKEFMIPRLYEVKIYGNDMDGYMSYAGPVKYAYNSGFDPFDVSLPYIGFKLFQKVKDNDPVVSPMETVWNDQYDFNVARYRQTVEEATDLGEILITTDEFLPDDKTPAERLMQMKYERILKLNIRTANGEIIPWAQNLNQTRSFSNRNKIDQYEVKMARITQYLNAKVGAGGARSGNAQKYEPAATTQQNLQASFNETQHIYTKFDQFVSESLNYLIRLCRDLVKYNAPLRNYGYDEFSDQLIKVDPDRIKYTNPYVYVQNAAVDGDKIQLVRNYLLGVLQNLKDLSMDTFIETVDADTMQELRALGRKIRSLTKQATDEQNKSAMDLMRMQQELKMQEKKFDANVKKMLQDAELLTKVLVTQIGAERFAGQWDIDMNKINDNIQARAMQIKADMEMLQAKLDHDMQKHREDLAIKRLELQKKAI